MSAVTSREPEWSPEDQAIILAALDAEATTCRAGHPIPENLKLLPKDQPADYVEPRYDGETLICLQCEFEAQYTKAWQDQDEADEKAKRPYRGGDPGARIIQSKRLN